MTFGGRLQQVRKAAGLSQEQLGELVGVVLLVAEFFALFAIQDAQIRLAIDSGVGYLPHAIQYAAVPPMPAVFGVTIAVIAAGAVLAAGGLFAMSGKRFPKKHRTP